MAASKAEGQEIVMVVGNTGAGKSAFINLLHGCQFALVVEFAPDASRGCLEKILDLLSENLVRHVVTIVDVALIAHAADEVITLVHTTTEAVEVGLRACIVRAHEGVSVKICRWLDPSDGK